MTLEHIIERLEEWGNHFTIYAVRSPDWNRASEAVLLPDDEDPKEKRFCYFLEVDIAKNVLRGWSYVRDGQVPDLAQRCEAIIYYAENDAYLMPEET